MVEPIRKLEVETIAEIFDIPTSMTGGLDESREIRGMLDFRPRIDYACVADDGGRIHRVESLGVHHARPVEDSYYLNDLVFGMPKPEPWTWWTDDVIDVTHISAWAGERCLGITDFGLIHVGPSGTFNVEWGLGGPPFVPVPIPARLRGRG